MAREEEINQPAERYSEDSNNYAEWSDDGGWSDSDDREFVKKAYIESAKWADKTMLDRVCQWLKENVKVFQKEDIGDFILANLRKAMKE